AIPSNLVNTRPDFMVKWISLPLALALLLVTLAASIRLTAADTNAAPETPRYFQAKGVVQRLDPDGKSVTIKHEEIPGYMAAMTMDFPVHNTNELRGLTSGDSITFRVCVTEKEGWVDHVTKSGTVQIVESTSPSFIHVIPDVDLLQTNEVM